MTDQLLGEVIGAKYIVQARLGSGGSSTVYLIKQLSTKQQFALKAISTEDGSALKLLERETQTLKRLDHPNIVRFVEDGYDDGHKLVYLVLEYLDGSEIKDYFNKAVTLNAKLDILSQVLEAISHAHSKDVIHRDLKPDNILVVAQGDSALGKVLDFGISS